jgi:hypothetical protein
MRTPQTYPGKGDQRVLRDISMRGLKSTMIAAASFRGSRRAGHIDRMNPSHRTWESRPRRALPTPPPA